MAQPAVQLPAELIDRIVDFLWDDRAALRNCTLAGRATQPSGRFHLFSSLRLTTRARLEQVLNIWRTSYLADFIHALELVESPRWRFEQPWVHLTPHILGCMLHRIEALAIHGVFWVESPPSFVAVLPVFTRLTKLALYDCVFMTQWHLKNFLCRLPCLCDLTLGRGVQWPEILDQAAAVANEVSGPVPSAERFRLTSLVIEAGDHNRSIEHAMLLWFESISPALPLRSVDLCLTADAVSLLDKVVGTLEDLTLNLQAYHLLADAQTLLIPLRRYIHLQRLCLRLPSEDVRIYNILRDVPICSAITTLEVDLCRRSPASVNWKRVGSILARGNFSNLRTIVVAYTWDKKRSTLPAWKEKMRKMLVVTRRPGVSIRHCVSFSEETGIWTKPASLKLMTAAETAALGNFI